MPDQDPIEFVKENGRIIGQRVIGSRTVINYGNTSCDIALSEIDDKKLAESYRELLRRVEQKNFPLNDPRVRLELHFIREDQPHVRPTDFPVIAHRNPLLTASCTPL